MPDSGLNRLLLLLLLLTNVPVPTPYVLAACESQSFANPKLPYVYSDHTMQNHKLELNEYMTCSSVRGSLADGWERGKGFIRLYNGKIIKM